jgi:hypothetical protein
MRARDATGSAAQASGVPQSVPQPDHGPGVLTMEDVLQLGLPLPFVGRTRPSRYRQPGRPMNLIIYRPAPVRWR